MVVLLAHPAREVGIISLAMSRIWVVIEFGVVTCGLVSFGVVR